MRRLFSALGALLLATSAPGGLVRGGAQALPGDTHTFLVIVRGVQVGTERSSVAHTSAGWIISSSGRQGPPVDLVISRFEMSYDADWQPQQLTVDATLAGKPFKLATSFGPLSAVSDVTQDDRSGTLTQPVSARTIVLPRGFYASYEALAARLDKTAVGARLPAYLAPQGEVTVAVDRITPRRIVASGTAEDIRGFDLTFGTGAASLQAEVWIDAAGRLARISIPSAATVVIRDDLASVMAREEIAHRAGDEQVFIPSERFNLAATVAKPADPGGRHPAVVLVPGSGLEDRELVIAGVPIFADVAVALADAGYLVVRYDKRGVGQSGGRMESAAMPEFADDALRVVDWTRRRKDVDADRVAILGYGEGGPVALLAAARSGHVAAVGLLASPGLTGRDAVIEQQRRALARAPLSDPDRQSKMALESRLIDAVLTGSGWDGVPDSLRRTADTLYFKSWLLFDPAAVVPKIDRPMLILEGSLDTETTAADADRLEQLGRARSKLPPEDTRKTIVPGVNHLLTAARTGDAAEYLTLDPKAVSPDVTAAIVSWLKDALARR